MAQPLTEPVIDPDLPIVDAHHHLWLLQESAISEMETRDSIYAPALAPTFRRYARYLLDEFLATSRAGTISARRSFAMRMRCTAPRDQRP